MTREERENAIRCLKLWIEREPQLQTYKTCLEALEQEPKTGHWKRISMDKYSEHAKYWYRCDRCGKDNLGDTDWCPNCGAKMD